MKKEDVIFLKLMIMILLQLGLFIIIDNYFNNSFVQSLSKENFQFNEFVDSFERCLILNQKMFIITISLSILMQILIIVIRKNQLNRGILVIFFLVIGLDCSKLFWVLSNSEKYQTKYILESTNSNLNNLRVRTYLYHYFKIKGDVKGIDMVINKGLYNLDDDDLAYLVKHRKDKKFENIVNPQINRL